MNLEFIPILADAMKHYYDDRDLEDLCSVFDVPVNHESMTGKLAYMAFSKQLIAKVDIGNNRRLLNAMVPSLLNRANEGVATTDASVWERQRFHEGMVEHLRPIESALSEGGVPEELAVAENHPFTAKSKIREFLAKAETPVTVVDNYIGLSTLDCLRDIQQPIKLLAGSHAQAIEDGFSRALAAFRAEGFSIEVRRHPRLHDRYILFNNRSWLVGSSLKDAGNKQLNIIEGVDIKTAIVAEVEHKWNESAVFQT